MPGFSPSPDDANEYPTIEEIAGRWGDNIYGYVSHKMGHKKNPPPAPKKRRIPSVDRTVLLPVANLRQSVQMLSEADVVRQYQTVYKMLLRFRTFQHYELRGKPIPKSNQKIAMWTHSAYVVLHYWVMLRKRMEDENIGTTEYPYGTSYNPFVTTTFKPSPLPPWFGNSEIHASHRAFLLKRNPEHYGQFQWPEKPSSRLKFPKMSSTAKKSVTLVSLEE